MSSSQFKLDPLPKASQIKPLMRTLHNQAKDVRGPGHANWWLENYPSSLAGNQSWLIAGAHPLHKCCPGISRVLLSWALNYSGNWLIIEKASDSCPLSWDLSSCATCAVQTTNILLALNELLITVSAAC